MATSINLSKITRVDLRDCWQNEATDFTPWLAMEDNLSLQMRGKACCFTAKELFDLDCNFDQCKVPKDKEEMLPPPPAELLADYFKKRQALDHEIDKALAEIQRILGIEINIEEL